MLGDMREKKQERSSLVWSNSPEISQIAPGIKKGRDRFQGRRREKVRGKK